MVGVGGEPGKGVGDRACLWIDWMRGFPTQGNYYKVGGFPMMAVVLELGAPAVIGAWGSGTPIIYLGYV